MSTRSGKRIHFSFHENTVKSEADITKSERKTRSKHVKENSDELNVYPKKRNYVTYPSDVEPGIDTADSKREGRTTRVLRNALKERNFPSSTETEEPTVDSRKSVQSTRRTRKFAENTEVPAGVILKDVETVKVEVPKPKKRKKKKAEQDQVTKVEVVVPKKSKKRKGRKSNSIVVEDIEPETLSCLHKSNMSVDSFHSAADSPLKNCDEPAPLPAEDMEQVIDTMNTTFENNDTTITVARKTRSTKKLNKTSTIGNVIEKETRKRKSSVKVSPDGSLKNAMFENGEGLDVSMKELKHKSSIKVNIIVSSEDIKDKPASTFDMEEKLNSSAKKTTRRATIDKTLTPNTINTNFDKDPTKVLSANKSKKKKSVVDETFDAIKDLESTTVEENDVNMTIDKVLEVIESAEKKRKSTVNAMMTMMQKPSPFKSTGKAKRKSIIGEAFDKDLEVNVNKQKKKTIMDATFCFENSSPFKLSPIKLFMTETKRNLSNTTYVKDLETNSESCQGPKSSIVDATFDLTSSSFKSANEDSLLKINNDSKRKSVIDTTYENDSETDSESSQGPKRSIVDATFDLTSSPFKSANEEALLKLNNDLKRKSVIDTTYEKDSDTDEVTSKKASIFDKDTVAEKINTTFDKDTMENMEVVTIENKRNTILQLPTHKIIGAEINSTFDHQAKKLDSTFEKNESSRVSSDSSIITLDKTDTSSISITSDESSIKENILNTTALLIESSLDESRVNTTQNPKKETPNTESVPPITPLKREGTFTKDNNTTQSPMKETPKAESVPPITPLKREGTFTKDKPELADSPNLNLSKTPTKDDSLQSAGFTPFRINKSSSKEKSMLLNVTKSIDKTWSSIMEPPRTTKVMFCSPDNNPTAISQIKRKVIKSNLKGSNKSFLFENSVSMDTRPAARKRSYTQSDADDARVKRKRLTDDLQQSVDRLSRPRTSSASVKLAEPTTPTKKHTTPSKNFTTPSKKFTTPSKKSDVKVSRTKLPNFAALHQKQFDKMESLKECQERRAKRAKQLLTPTGATNMLERISPKENAAEPEKPKEAAEKSKEIPAKSNEAPEKPKKVSEKPKKPQGIPKEVPEKPKEAPKKPETPIKSLPTFKSINPGYTRFGFKLNLDVNPFSIPSKTQTMPKRKKPNELNRQEILPSLAGATSARKEVAKQRAMREKSFNNRRNVTRTENRTVIKGVRTNRRFELQMLMRNV